MNRLHGVIRTIKSAASINKVEILCGQTLVSCVTLNLPDAFGVGTGVEVVFKETEVGLGKGVGSMISIANLFACRVVSVEEGEILSEVTLDLAGETIRSIITTDSLHRLAIVPGDAVTALVKSNEVSLQKGDDD